MSRRFDLIETVRTRDERVAFATAHRLPDRVRPPGDGWHIAVDGERAARVRVRPQASAVAARESARGRVVEMSTAADFATLDALLDGRAKADAVCPWCGPVRSAAVKSTPQGAAAVGQRRQVLSRITARAAASSGYVRDNNERRPVNREALQRARVPWPPNVSGSRRFAAS